MSIINIQQHVENGVLNVERNGRLALTASSLTEIVDIMDRTQALKLPWPLSRRIPSREMI